MKIVRALKCPWNTFPQHGVHSRKTVPDILPIAKVLTSNDTHYFMMFLRQNYDCSTPRRPSSANVYLASAGSSARHTRREKLLYFSILWTIFAELLV